MKRFRLYLIEKQPDGLHKAALANCGSFITHITRVLKGAPADPGHTKFVIPGGTYKFEDGTQALIANQT
jgi:hypothetical protein